MPQIILRPGRFGVAHHQPVEVWNGLDALRNFGLVTQQGGVAAALYAVKKGVEEFAQAQETVAGQRYANRRTARPP